MEIFVAVVTLALVAFLAAWFLYFVFWAIVEPTYMLLFNKPVYVHFYPFPKKLDDVQKSVLQREFRFYSKLSPVRKAYFDHRVYNFIDNYTFLGRNDLVVTQEMKLKIAATYIMLTFGMRRYLPDVFEAIIIYPDIFESRNGDYHKGEFNPAAKAIVFSWKHFLEGMAFDSDNLNLGLHEFAHVLHFDASSARRRPGSSVVIYSDTFNQILAYIADAANRQQLLDSNYFRAYAYTNQYEFIAVILEYFFETPHEFRQKLPELYEMVKKMINFREG
jgi:Mlc titration factor MtfA (ptsG expression regulator)